MLFHLNKCFHAVCWQIRRTVEQNPTGKRILCNFEMNFLRWSKLDLGFLPPCLSLLSGQMNLIKCQFCPCCMVSAFLDWQRNFLSFDFTLVWSGIWSYEVYIERNLKVSFWKISKALNQLRLSLKVTSVQINKKNRVCLWFWEQELADVFMANLSKDFLRTVLPHP